MALSLHFFWHFFLPLSFYCFFQDGLPPTTPLPPLTPDTTNAHYPNEDSLQKSIAKIKPLPETAFPFPLCLHLPFLYNGRTNQHREAAEIPSKISSYNSKSEDIKKGDSKKSFTFNPSFQPCFAPLNPSTLASLQPPGPKVWATTDLPRCQPADLAHKKQAKPSTRTIVVTPEPPSLANVLTALHSWNRSATNRLNPPENHVKQIGVNPLRPQLHARAQAEIP